MPLPDYGVLRAKPVEFGREDSDPKSPHFQIVAEAGGVRWRIPVNVRSTTNQTNDPNKPDKSLILFRLEDPIVNTTLPSRLNALSEGFHGRGDGVPTLDYLREPVFDRTLMRAVKFTGPDVSDDVQDIIEIQIRRAIASASPIFVFGASFDATVSPRPPDLQFHTTRGVHDIHMNQGNPPPGSFFTQNGVFQDGGLLIRQSDDHWVGFFVAFQTQLIPTDNSNGRPLPGAKPILTTAGTPPPNTTGPVQIIAALVNPVGVDTGLETVTLINISAAAVNLNGWKLIDRNQKTEVLSGTVDAGETVRIHLSGTGVQLSNNGGTIRIDDGSGRTIDTASYDKADADTQGVTVTF